MRRPLIMGNWKMNGSRAFAIEFAEGLLTHVTRDVEMALFPPVVYLEAMEKILHNKVGIGAQDVSCHESGAYTGEVSAHMLVDIQCTHVLIGHSERRQYHGEEDTLVAKKFKHAVLSGLTPVLCVGENLTERQQDKAVEVVTRQIKTVLETMDPAQWSSAVIAYEPVWAIGTGETATPEQAQEMHAVIRQLLAAWSPLIAEQTRIVYGGSMKPANAAELLALPDVDGGLVGGASLKLEDFVAICSAT